MLKLCKVGDKCARLLGFPCSNQSGLDMKLGPALKGKSGTVMMELKIDPTDPINTQLDLNLSRSHTMIS